MFKLPEFPSIDFSALDLNALRDSNVAKRIAAIDVPRIDTEKVTAFVRDAAYVTIGLGVTAFEGVQARLAVIDEGVQARLAVIDKQVRGLIRNAA